MWKADEMDVKQFRIRLDEALQAGNVEEALAAAGGLAIRGEEAQAKALAARLSPQAIRETVGSLGAEPLDQATAVLVQAGPELQDADESERQAIADELIQALELRDRLESIRIAAELLLQEKPAIDQELDASLIAFDELMGEELWRLLPLGELRAARTAAIAPSYRRRFWWWHRGHDLPASALDSLGVAARILHLFPAAREELERLIQAERDLDQLTHPRQPGRVLSIADHLSKRARATQPEGRIAVAAAETERRLELPGTRAILVLTGDELILDYPANTEPVKGRPPQIEVPGLTPLVGIPTGDPGSFSFSLGAEQMGALRGKLRVPFAGGDEVVELEG